MKISPYSGSLYHLYRTKFLNMLKDKRCVTNYLIQKVCELKTKERKIRENKRIQWVTSNEGKNG